jgi:hypothetical protein
MFRRFKILGMFLLLCDCVGECTYGFQNAGGVVVVLFV